MARSKKKTLGQQVVGVATVGMPAPVKGVVGSKWGSRAVLILVGGMLVTGVVTIQWTNGRPQLKLDRDRAREIKQNVARKIEEAEEARENGATPLRGDGETGPIREWLGRTTSQSVVPAPGTPPIDTRIESAAQEVRPFVNRNTNSEPAPYFR